MAQRLAQITFRLTRLKLLNAKWMDPDIGLTWTQAQEYFALACWASRTFPEYDDKIRAHATFALQSAREEHLRAQG